MIIPYTSQSIDNDVSLGRGCCAVHVPHRIDPERWIAENRPATGSPPTDSKSTNPFALEVAESFGELNGD
jgi:hypothetical protein